MNVIVVSDEQAKAIESLATWLAFVEAGRTLDGDPPLEDRQIALSYLGNGASHTVQVGALRAIAGLHTRGLKTVCVVLGSSGEYEDRQGWLVRAFPTWAEAEDFAERAGKQAQALNKRYTKWLENYREYVEEHPSDTDGEAALYDEQPTDGTRLDPKAEARELPTYSIEVVQMGDKGRKK